MAEMPLPHGYVAVVDDDDEALVRQHRWRPLVQGRTVYAIARLPRLRGKQRSIYMHRLIVEAKRNERVAHRDGDGLNNTRRNLDVRNLLRAGRRLPAGVRMSKYQGVAWDAESAKWEAVVGPHWASVRIGLYPTEEAAARAYDEAAFDDCPALRGLIGNFRAPSGGRGVG
jgi:AP2-like factor (euAP2 lineage)